MTTHRFVAETVLMVIPDIGWDGMFNLAGHHY